MAFNLIIFNCINEFPPNCLELINIEMLLTDLEV